MTFPRLTVLVAAALLASACARAESGDNDWRLRIKKEGDGWTFALNGPMDYGPPGHRIKGSGAMVERTRSVPAFTKIRLEGSMDLRVSQAGADAVRVAADDNIEPLVESKVEGDTLVLRVQSGAGFSTRRAPTISVDSKSLQAVAIKGSGDVSIERFKGDTLNLALSGSGDMRIGLLEVRELTAALRGSGDLRVAGRADTQSWTLQGSGDVDARSLGGHAVKAQLSGSGDLSYAGRPQVRQTVNGSGEVNRR